MLKFVVFISIFIVGVSADCTFDSILKCGSGYKYNAADTSADICSKINLDEKCLADAGCDTAPETKVTHKLCGPGTLCDMKEAVRCAMVAEPAAAASYELLKSSISEFKSCLGTASCAASASKVGNEICMTV